MRVASSLGIALSLACLSCSDASRGTPAPVAAESAAPRSSGADDPQPIAAAPVAGSDLLGTWVEYWAVDGGADTEQYAFSDASHFEWQASAAAHPVATAPGGADARSQTAVHKAGAFRIEREGPVWMLVLEVQHETFAACAAPCSGGAGAREVDHSTPLVERYELGECPSNPEALRVDASYTCRAFGGKAFWRKSNEARANAARSAG